MEYRGSEDWRNYDWGDPSDEELYGYSVGVGSEPATVTTIKPKEEAKPKGPPKDKKGNVLTREDIQTAIENLKERVLSVDDAVSGIKDPEAQAKRVEELVKGWEKQAKKLEGQLRQAEDYKRQRQRELGYRPYGMEDDEGNKVVTKMMDEQAEWFHAEVDALKDKLAARLRDDIDNLRGEGFTVNANTRDKIYNSLVDEEVIESWEPMEF